MNLLAYLKSHAPLLAVWLLQGVLVGFGAILPGVSGGTLCVVFGMYRPIIEVLSNLKDGLKKNGPMLFIFLMGVGVGFVGLSGLAAWLLERDTAIVTCAFIGLILGTAPELWKDAGAQGRGKGSVLSLLLGFSAMLLVLVLLKTQLSLTVAPGTAGYLLCGVLWGLSFIVPGLSSSSLLLLFGLYQPMLKGISELDFRVLLPMGIGLAVCVLLLSKVVGAAYKKHFSAMSHGVLGIVLATAVMILPPCESVTDAGLYALVIVGGAAASFLFTKACNRAKKKA